MLIDKFKEKFSHLRQFYNSEEEFEKHLMSGEVTVSVKDIIEDNIWMGKENALYKSRYGVNEMVTLNFFTSGEIKNCKVIKVHFTESKVLYDVEVEMIIKNDIEGDQPYHTRLYNIDSVFVNDPK